jgi:hypothetical protein
MRLASTLKMVSLASDPAIFNDGEIYFNTVEKTVRLASDGIWINMVNTDNLEASFLREVSSITDSGSYMLMSSEQNSILLVNSASATTVIIPNSSTEEIEVGSSIKVARVGSGTVEFTEESGVTLRTADSNYLTARWTTVELIKIDTDEWLLDGEFPDIY